MLTTHKFDFYAYKYFKKYTALELKLNFVMKSKKKNKGIKITKKVFVFLIMLLTTLNLY